VGFAVFDTPDRLIDFGVAYVQPAQNDTSLDRIMKLITLHQPDVLLTRAITQEQNTVSKRIRTLLKRIALLAGAEKLKLREVSRTEVQEYFSEGDYCSKYDISQKLIERYPSLAPYEFPVRKRWKGEHHHVGIFDAVAMIRACFN
tara:strand:- start:832 stop:1266 length:435 start_codon:yes stop_codon:yes gene_type:complete